MFELHEVEHRIASLPHAFVKYSR